MTILQAAILGIVQGIAEFLPISSSGHLVIASALLAKYNNTEIPAESATMNIALHFGTLLSIAVVYWKDLLELRSDLRTIGLIILATIPVGIAGIMFKDQIEALMSSPLPVGFALIVTAVVLLISQRLQRDALTIREVSWPTVAIIGLFQAVAILPGISRSGSTIAGGLLCGLQRSEATRFSFLIAIPAIGGATIVKAKDLLSGEAAVSAQEIGPLAVGTVVSFLVGLVALKALIRVVSANRLHWFAGYCLTAGLATVAWQLLG